MKDLAVLLGIGKKMKDAPPSSGASLSEDPEESGMTEYGDELATILNVSDDDKEDFIKALTGFVKAC